jgi:hypothetical protein
MKCRGGTKTAGNISLVPQNIHAAFHMLFGNGTTEEIAAVLNSVWIDPADLLMVVPRVTKK